MAGLLHDIGLVLMCNKLPSLFLSAALQSKSNKEPLQKAEMEVIGFNHTDVGGLLLKTWELPKVFEEAVKFHHNPAEATQFYLEASVIHVSDVLADCSHSLKLGHNAEVDSTIPNMDEDALKFIDLPKDIYLSTICKETVSPQKT